VPAQIVAADQRLNNRTVEDRFELPERPSCVGLEAGPLSEWLARGLAQAGLDAVLMET